MSVKKAFTLVELLVVIAIIALLISILAPSLKVAKDLAKQMICMTHLSAVAKANLFYVECNRGMFPPWRNAYTGVKWPYGLAALGKFGAGDIPAHDADGKLATDGSMSYLYRQALLNGEMMYCPLQEGTDNPRWKRSTYGNPYAEVPAPTVGSAHISVSYLFNPNVTAVGGAADFVYRRIDETPTSVILALDIFLRTYDIVHKLGGEGSGQWASAFSGGNVNIMGSAAAYKHMSDSGGYWADSDWPVFVAGFKLLQGF